MPQFIHGNCLKVLPTIADASIDAVIADPPYPEIDREYGRMTEAAWHEMMRRVVAECRRVLKPHGSAVFILQPNSEQVGRMRLWLWEFVAWAGREWGLVQDAYWWNFASPPTIHCNRRFGLMRPSLKMCVWLGPADCFRSQDSVLWEESEHARVQRLAARAGRYTAPVGDAPSGHKRDKRRVGEAAAERGGVTPFNVFPACNSDPSGIAGGHGAATPYDVASWWVRYLTKPGDVVLDPFSGSGTIPLAAESLGRQAIGIEQYLKYHEIAEGRAA